MMTNPVWVWLIESGLGGYTANELCGGPPSEEAGPCWCFDRFGRTETNLPDGRIIKIGGEHEDSYDPDFYIYNDVVVSDGAGNVQIRGYPEDIFPPTDFHTADLVEGRIIIIGNLSYPKQRKDKTQVLTLDASTYRVEHADTSGVGPGWLHKHSSALDVNGGGILVRGGLVDDPRWPALVENIDDWRLDLGAWRWERLTNRAWPRFVFVRADDRPNHLYWLYDLMRARASNRPDRFADKRAEFLRDLGDEPRLDLLETLYAPNVSHEKLPEIEGEFRVSRVNVDGVTVRYVEGNYDLRLTVEGNLPPDIVELLRSDLLTKLETIENTKIDCIPVMVD